MLLPLPLLLLKLVLVFLRHGRRAIVSHQAREARWPAENHLGLDPVVVAPEEKFP